MDQHELNMLAENEREWRQYMIKQLDELGLKVDRIDKELSTFKVRVFAFASAIGGAAGLSTEYLKNLFIGG